MIYSFNDTYREKLRFAQVQLSYRESGTCDSLSGTRSQGLQYDEVAHGIRDSKIFKRDRGPGTPEVGTGTLMNSLLAWKFECSNKSIDILLEN